MIDLKKNRESYTRVTSILYPFSGLDKIDPEIVARAGRRGTRVHNVCESIINDLGEFDVDDEIRGYVDSFKLWWARGHEVLEVEKRFWNDDYQITGQVDLITADKHTCTIVDLKTSSRPSKTWAIQGAAYAFLASKEGYDVSNIQFIHLNKYGKEPKIYEYEIDHEMFLDVFRVWEYFFKEK